MPTPKKVRTNKTIIDETRSVGETFLHTLQMQRIVPKTFSGVLTPKFGNMIMVWQFDKNKMVGACIINIKNASVFSKKILDAPNSFDWATIQEEVATGSELSSV